MNNEAAVGFVRNLQGDIIAVVNQEGTALLEYSYDPWGKVTITQNGENLTEQERQIIAVLCPFAYRGYNYDFTTGLYYLQSRYYNPEWGRFLNVDDTNILLSTQGENLGANLFAYCNNNPVNYADYTGYECEELIKYLLDYVIVPIAYIIKKFDENGISSILDKKGNMSISINPSGLIAYHFTFYGISMVGDFVNFQETFDFSLYFGKYNAWRNFFDAYSNRDELMGGVLDLADGALTSLLEIMGAGSALIKIAEIVNLAPLKIHRFRINSFIKKSERLLDLQKIINWNHRDTMYYALGAVRRICIEHFQGGTQIYYEYWGDKCIEYFV